MAESSSATAIIVSSILGDTEGTLEGSASGQWIPVVQCDARFSVESFERVITNLIRHPELTSGLILRADILSDDTFELSDEQSHETESIIQENPPHMAPLVPGYELFRRIRRRLVPKVPRRDPELEQDCSLLQRSGRPDDVVVLMVPLLKDGERVPHYHPDVAAIAFRYIPASDNESAEKLDAEGRLRLEIIASLGSENTALDTDSRLFKTCKVLLTTAAKHSQGLHNGYAKRMHHDTVVPREIYQDLYQIMKEKYKHLKNEWAESTDPTKNVFEDIAIATFLILLWKDIYEARESNEERRCGQPPGGFIDMGCGAGLLVHILRSEGYEGIGIDVRARKSWKYYPEQTQKHLFAFTLDPLEPTFPSSDIFKPGCFLIGNHADELSPWLPVIASLVENAAYMSIPCCSWALDSRFYRSDPQLYPPLGASLMEAESQLENRFGPSRVSVYRAYLCWLMALSKECGFESEIEALRIPSTRNWAIIGRNKIGSVDGREKAKEILAVVGERKLFKAREGTSSHS
ncbi:tRNA(Ser) Um(44) 2'-O-methyltransferase [Serendipita sp. 400]|nr:tRNA(Ser) Um(44) 2'-O-methyltransferase [Serendipita sp. 400]